MLEPLTVALEELFLPIIAIVALLGSGFIAFARVGFSPPTKGYAVFLLAFGFLGGITGLVAGASREGIVGALMTSMLGIVSALLTYLFSKETLKQWRHYIPYAIMLLVICALAGLCIGGIYRAKLDNSDRAYKQWQLEYEKVYLEVLKEERLVKLRAQERQEIKAEGGLPSLTKTGQARTK